MTTLDLLLEAVERSEDVRVLTLREPYASLVAWGVKTIETRPHSTSHRGLLAIHVALGPALPCDSRHIDRLPAGVVAATPDRGSIVAVVNLLAVHDLEPSDEEAACFYAAGRKAWALSGDVVRIEPVRFRGCQGFGRVAAKLLVSKVKRGRAA